MPLRFLPEDWGRVFTTELGEISLIRTGPGEINISPADNYYSFMLLTPQPQRIISLANSQEIEFVAPAGTLEIIPPHSIYFARWNIATTNIILTASRKALQNLVEIDFRQPLVELHPPAPGFRDEAAHQIGRLLQPALLSTDSMNDLYLDSLVNIYWIYIIRNYSSIAEPQNSRNYSSLSPHVWNRVDDYIRSNLANRITLRELASICNLSESHFRRAFQRTVGMPPHQYLLKLRVEAAERLLVETNFSLSLIAQSCGFASQSHITRVMKQWRGITPGQIRKLQLR